MASNLTSPLLLDGAPVLPGVGGQVIAGNTFFVHYTDGQDLGVHGTKDLPLKTLDYAIGRCTANNGDYIFLLPGHNEDYAASGGFDADVAGITIVNLGQGDDAATFDFNDATAKCIVGADSVSILGKPKFRPSVTAVAIGIDLETGVTGCKLDVDLVMGEDGAGTDEFIKGIHLTSGNHDTDLSGTRILSHASAAQSTHAIHIDAASNRCKFNGVLIQGPWATGGIVEDAAGLNHEMVGASVDTTGTNYSFHGSSTFAVRRDNLDAGNPEAADDVSSDLIIVQSDVKTVLSNLVVAKSDLLTVLSNLTVAKSDILACKSDLVVIQASEDSDVVFLKSDIAAIKSDLVVLQASEDSDVVFLKSDIAAVKSDLVALQAAEDSDMVVLKSDVVVCQSDLTTIRGWLSDFIIKYTSDNP